MKLGKPIFVLKINETAFEIREDVRFFCYIFENRNDLKELAKYFFRKGYRIR